MMYIIYFDYANSIKNWRYPAAFLIKFAASLSNARKKSRKVLLPLPSHVGLLLQLKGKDAGWFLIEARGEGIVISPVKETIKHFNGDLYVEKIEIAYGVSNNLITFLTKSIGKKYSVLGAVSSFTDGFFNRLFKPSKKRYFCSHFVTEALQIAGHQILNEKGSVYEQEPVDLMFEQRNFNNKDYYPHFIPYDARIFT